MQYSKTFWLLVTLVVTTCLGGAVFFMATAPDEPSFVETPPENLARDRFNPWHNTWKPEFDDPEDDGRKLRVDPDLRFTLIELAKAGDYAELETTLQSNLGDYQDKRLHERDIRYLFNSFGLVSPELRKALIKWNSESASWSSSVALGMHYYMDALAWRGRQPLEELPERSLAEYQRNLRRAHRLFKQSDELGLYDDLFADLRLRCESKISNEPTSLLVANAIQKSPESVDLYFAAVDVLRESSESKAVELDLLRYIDNLAQDNPNLSELSGIVEYYRGRDLLIGGETWAARESFERALKSNPGSMRYRKALASAFTSVQSYTRGDELLEIVARYQPNDYDLLIRRARAWLYYPNYKKAASYVEQALNLSEFAPEANLVASEVYGSLGRKDLFEKHYAALEPYGRTGSGVLNNVANEVVSRGRDLEWAESLYERLLSAEPYDPWTSFKLAKIHNERGKCDVVDDLESYFVGCNYKLGSHKVACGEEISNLVYRMVFELKESGRCPEAATRKFDGELSSEDVRELFKLENLGI
ncbi:hypothetical protein GCM10008090_14890 [Arenicella chitinivorans]|uniref:DUF4034 domain-containing protein n=1 Tax=Arenicella chitinivorans TaxID=1329800 RepID=A0A918VKL0_9GAMM|nr:hypothetical protein [Arenicella chitinivorans]GHA06245.1 hypothetical protein GCM10008090_14890 [Arenicella chitinivorans]